MTKTLVTGEGDDHRIVSAGGDNHGVKFALDGFKGILVDFAVGADVDADVLDAIDLVVQDFARQTLGWNGLAQLAANFLIRFVKRNAVTAQGQLPCDGQTGGTTAENRDFSSCGRLQFRSFDALRQATQFLHGDRMIKVATAAGVHAQVGTDLPANAGGERRIFQVPVPALPWSCFHASV